MAFMDEECCICGAPYSMLPKNHDEHCPGPPSMCRPIAEVVPLRQKPSCKDIAKTLRTIADDIEKDEYYFKPDFAILVVARESARQVDDGIIDNFQFRTHGLGEAGYFNAKGALAAALARWETEDD